MTGSVYERVLGFDLELLAPELRDYFAGRSVGTGQGVFTEAGLRLRFLRPVLAFMAWQRILFPEHGRDVPFTIVNTPTSDGALDAARIFHLPGGDRPLEDTMRVVDGRLHDFMGRNRGFEVRMVLTIAGGSVHMRSDRQWLRFGRARIPILQLATVSVIESWADGSQHVPMNAANEDGKFLGRGALNGNPQRAFQSPVPPQSGGVTTAAGEGAMRRQVVP